MPGTEPRNRIDKLFSPESIKANLPTLVGKGMTESGMKYGRRVADRTGAVGMAVGLSNPKLVSISDDTSFEAAHTGGFKAGESRTDSRSVDVTAGLNTPMRPTQGAVGSTALGGAARWTPWSKTKTTGTETSGSVDRNQVTPATGRTVLVQLDAQVTVVGESRAGNTVRKGSSSVAGSVVTLPGGVFVRVSEDVARDMGVLPAVESAAVAVEQGTMAPPSTLRPGEPGALGLGVVERAPDLSALVPQLRDNLGKLGKNLLPKSVLDDSMNNLRRLTDLTSDASVKALVDSALDGGVPLLVHDPGVFGKDTYQVTLKAVPGTPVFEGAVNDGVEIEHTATGVLAVSETAGGATGWGAGLKVPGAALPKTGDANLSANVGGSAAVNAGQTHSHSTTTSTTKQQGQLRVGSGPAVRYTVPVTFELVVEKGSREIGRATSGEVDMSVRVHADNQKTSSAHTPFAAHVTTRPAEDGDPGTVREWQETSAVLPPLASVENLRGAQILQDAAVRALAGAGAGSGLTGKGTGALNALRSGLALESLQPNLPGMLDGAFEVPGLHEASLTTSQHAQVKVYAKLVNPRLEALSDGVQVFLPRSVASSTSSDAKHSETGDLAVALGPGGVTSAKPDVGVSVAGVEIRHAAEDSAALSGGSTHNPSSMVKAEGRTGLVAYDVEYRVVASLGRGRVGVVDVSVPGAAQVRMFESDAAAALGRALPDDLGTAQTGVHDAAKAWRSAEVAADQARHAAQKVINAVAPQLAVVTTRQSEVETADRTVADASAALVAAQRHQAEAEQAVSRAQSAVDEGADAVYQTELDAALAEQVALAEQLDESAAREDALAAASRAAELAARARDRHAELASDLGTAQARQEAADDAVRAAEEDLRQAQVAAEAARALHSSAVRAEQDLRAEVTRAEAEVGRTRVEAAQAQRAWWEAKAAVDQEVSRFNAPPPQPPPPPTEASASPGEPTASPAEPSTPASPVAAPAPQLELSLDFPPGGTSLTFQQLVAVERLAERLTELQATRAAEGLPAPVVEITGDHAAHVAELLALEAAVEIEVAPGRANAADLRVRLEQSAETSAALEDSPGSSAAPEGPAEASTAPDDSAETSDPPPPLDDQLSGLATSAMADASPLMRSVESVLSSDPRKYVQSEAGLHLLRASVVLHTRTDEVARLIAEHGVDHVADAFIRQFERPIIETAQRELFADLDTAAFGSWAHQLWDTIGNTPSLAENPELLAAEIFNHDKGYNRATNFAQQAALADIVGPPPLAEVIADRPAPDNDTSAQAMWLYQVFTDAGLLAADGTDTASGFTELARQHRAALEPGLGPLSEQRIAALRQELVDMVMLDDDVESPTSEALRHVANEVLTRPAPPSVTPNGLYAAVAHLTQNDAAALRKHVVNRGANDPSVAGAAADFAAGRPMLPVHLNGALVENVNWSMRPDPDENRSAGNARDLLGHLIATHLGVNVVIHQGGPPVVLAPLGGQSQGSVEVDLVVVNGQATYRPHQ